MPPRLFWTSIMLIQTSLVLSIPLLLNSVSLRYPEQIFHFRTTYIFSLYYSISLLHLLRNNNLKQNKFPPSASLSFLLAFFETPKLQTFYLLTFSEILKFLVFSENSKTFLNLTQVQLQTVLIFPSSFTLFYFSYSAYSHSSLGTQKNYYYK